MGEIQKLDIDSLRDTVINCLKSQVKCLKQVEKCKDDISICIENQLNCYKDIQRFSKVLSDFDNKLLKFDKKLTEIDNKRLFREFLLYCKYKELLKKRDNDNKMWYLFLYLFLCIVCTIINLL